MEIPELLTNLGTVQQAAKLTGLSEGTIYKRIATGDIPAYRVGRTIRIDLSQLARPINAGGGHSDAA